MQRVMVTGFGAVSPVGLTAEATWEALLRGDSGVDSLDTDWSADLPVRIAARVGDGIAESLSVRETRRLDRVEQFALVAGREAWALAGAPEVEPTRLAVVMGTGIGGIATTIEQDRMLQSSGPRRVSPHTVTMLMANGAAAWLSIELGAKGGARTPASACASGAEAIAMGREMILAGSADVVVCGGTEAAITQLTLAAFAQTRALSKLNDDPTRASRPFDTARDGFVLGEGAAVLVLEREDHAMARRAKLHGVVAGGAVTSDAFDIVGADPANQARTITSALRSAGLSPSDIGFVHAHATSTPAGDLNEAIAMGLALPDGPPVTSTKSSTGHLLGASGALSSVASLLALRDRQIPPTGNIDELDPAIDLDVVRGTPRPTAAQHAIVNSFGFGGHNATLVLSSP
jgi:3-oxoacyl-[acyl-carrier-protein] synthase II